MSRVPAKVRRPASQDERGFTGAVANECYRYRRPRKNVGCYRAPVEASEMLRYALPKMIVEGKFSHKELYRTGARALYEALVHESVRGAHTIFWRLNLPRTIAWHSGSPSSAIRFKTLHPIIVLPVVRKKQSRPLEPATAFADRVAPKKSVGTHVSSSATRQEGAFGREPNAPNWLESCAGLCSETRLVIIRSEMEPSKEEIEAFVRRNESYYLTKWQQILDGTGTSAGGNWAALLFTGLWLPYRKLYGVALVFWGIVVVSAWAEMLFVSVYR